MTGFSFGNTQQKPFSFGGPSNTTGPGTETESPAPAFGGLRTSQGASDPSKPAFSFGTPAAATSAASSTPAAPAAAPTPGEFSFGGAFSKAFSSSAEASTSKPLNSGLASGVPADSKIAQPATSSTSLFGGSTTPAHPPPTNLFGSSANPSTAFSTTGGLSFGGASSVSKSTSTASAPAPAANGAGNASSAAGTGNFFGNKTGGFSFGGMDTAPLSTSTGGSASGASQPSSAPSVFGQPATSSISASKVASSSSIGAGSTGVSGSSGGFNFGGASLKPSGSSAELKDSTTTPSVGGFSFGKPAEKKEESKSIPASAPGGFSFGKPAEKKNDSKPTDANASDGFSFGGSAPATSSTGGEKKDSASTFAASISTSAAPAVAPAGVGSAAAPASSLFDSKHATSASTSVENATSKAAQPQQTASVTPSAQDVSAGITVTPLPAPSLLRGRTMDEIVSSWTSSLSSSVASFSKLSGEILVWDDLLRRSGSEISQLLAGLAKVEESQIKVGQLLDYIEGQQADLEGLLNGYEKQVEELCDLSIGASATQAIGFGGAGGGTSSGKKSLRGGDLERERMYTLAESLDAQLGDLGSNLATMINDINSSLGSKPQQQRLISKTNSSGARLPALPGGGSAHSGDDDAVQQILAILNAHLNSLRWIDSAVKSLRARIQGLRRGVVE